MPSTPIPRFRPMREEDTSRPELVDFRCGPGPWDEEVARFMREGRAWKAHRPPKSQTLLLCADDGEGEILGFVTLVARQIGYPAYRSTERIPALLIDYLGVRSQHQGQQYGRRMLADMVATAKHMGLKAVFLFVDVRNTKAIGIYERMGFRAFSDEHVFSEGTNSYRALVLTLQFDQSTM